MPHCVANIPQDLRNPIIDAIFEYIASCCRTIGIPCHSVGIIRLITDVSEMLKRRGYEGKHERAIRDMLEVLKYRGLADIVDGVVVNFRTDVFVVENTSSQSKGDKNTSNVKRKTLLDYFK